MLEGYLMSAADALPLSSNFVFVTHHMASRKIVTLSPPCWVLLIVKDSADLRTLKGENSEFLEITRCVTDLPFGLWSSRGQIKFGIFVKIEG